MSTAEQTVAPAMRAGRGAIAAAVIGNWLEFFDFTVYGFFAVIIGKLYFPSADSTNSLLLSVGTFAAGFFTRPLGSVLLGVYADRKGRKAALNVTILLMALGTGLIAIAPTYTRIGVASPVVVSVRGQSRQAPRIARAALRPPNVPTNIPTRPYSVADSPVFGRVTVTHE